MLVFFGIEYNVTVFDKLKNLQILYMVEMVWKIRICGCNKIRVKSYILGTGIFYLHVIRKRTH